MKQFFKFEVHEYMDLHPTIEVRVFEDENAAKEYAHYMNTNYSGGRTTYLGQMTSADAREYILNEIVSIVKDYNKFKDSPNNVHHVSKEELTDYVIKNVTLLNECYPSK